MTRTLKQNRRTEIRKTSTIETTVSVRRTVLETSSLNQAGNTTTTSETSVSNTTMTVTEESIKTKTTHALAPLHFPLSKNTRGEIEISLAEFSRLRQSTKERILSVYDKVMNPSSISDLKFCDSYSNICNALRYIGVEAMSGLSEVEDLLAKFVDEWNSLCFSWYTPDSDENLKSQASRRHWGLDELKAIAAWWMQGKNEAQVLQVGRQLMEIGTTWKNQTLIKTVRTPKADGKDGSSKEVKVPSSRWLMSAERLEYPWR